MSGPDVYDYGQGGYHSPDEGIWYPDYNESPGLYDILSQAISQGAQTAQVIGSGYPPGSNVSIQYPQYGPYCGPSGCGGGTQPQQQLPLPQLMPQAQQQPQAKTGVLNLSSNELLILGLIGFAFVFGRRGR